MKAEENSLKQSNAYVFNIAASYDLASHAAKAIYGTEIRLEYFEDYFDRSKADFIKKVAVPEKWTVLHEFLYEFNQQSWEQAIDAVSASEMFDEIAHIFKVTGIEAPVWFTVDGVEGHRDELDAMMKEASRIEAKAAFEILFQDKDFLFRFHSRIKEVLRLSDTTYDPQYQDSERKILRAAYLPEWLKNGVFFRDKGRCQKCFKDVSGTLHVDNKLHLDHILPLNQWGTNDPTNFQLLCQECNLGKTDKLVTPKNAIRYSW